MEKFCFYFPSYRGWRKLIQFLFCFLCKKIKYILTKKLQRIPLIFYNPSPIYIYTHIQLYTHMYIYYMYIYTYMLYKHIYMCIYICFCFNWWPISLRDPDNLSMWNKQFKVYSFTFLKVKDQKKWPNQPVLSWLYNSSSHTHWSLNAVKVSQSECRSVGTFQKCWLQCCTCTMLT